jgi:D-amino-acid dehydrogenase
MRIIVVGTGVIGLASAWALACDRNEVVILETGPGPGLGTSYANGALLTPSMAEPWNSPGCFRALLGSIGRDDAAFKLRLGALPALAGWGLRFLWNSREEPFHRSARANLHLALASLRAMERLRSETGIGFGRRTGGSLKIFRNEAALSRAHQAARLLSDEGIDFRLLSPAETALMEPGLEPIVSELSGAIHYPVDESGDAYLFCTGLAEALAARGVTIRYSTDVTAFIMTRGRISGVAGPSGRFEADAVVIAAGWQSWPLLGRAGLSLPIRPAKGYSATIGMPDPPLDLPIIDDEFHAVAVPMKGCLRVAGMAEFGGFDRRLDARRVAMLTRFARSVLPTARFEDEEAVPWCGLRAMSADGVPLIGKCRVDGLWINSGHGHLGWTMAAGSAVLLADLMANRTPGFDPAPFSPSRFRR